MDNLVPASSLLLQLLVPLIVALPGPASGLDCASPIGALGQMQDE